MLGFRRSVLGSMLTLGLGGCAATPAPSPARHAETAPMPIGASRVEALISEVATLRGLPQRAAIPVYLLDDVTFLATLRQRTPNANGTGSSDAFLAAFNLLPETGPGALRPSTAREVIDEQLLAYYDFERHHIVARTRPPRGAQGADAQMGVLAHEIVHALQDQHFSRARPAAFDGQDGRLAYHAMLEGDATLTMIAYLAGERGIPLRRAIRRAADLSHDVPIESLVASEGGAALRDALPILRARLLFPYRAGTSMAAELYMAGGLQLLNRLNTQPPVSTEQVLHPEKYLAGELPIVVRAPSAPPGYRVVASDTLGELATSVVLERCASAPLARAAAAGWGGDRFTLLEGPNGQVALLWSTAWDTEADAKEFVAVLGASPTCLRTLQVGAASIDGAPVVLTRGDRVAIIRGLPEPLGREWASALLELPSPAPKAVPVDGYRIRPHAPLPIHESGAFFGNVYASRFLGIAATLPPGVPGTIGKGALELKIGRRDVVVAGVLTLSDRMTTPRCVEEVLQEIARGFVKGLKGKPIAVVDSRPITLPLGYGIERLCSVTGTNIFMRAVMVPVCSGNGSYVFIQTFAAPYAKGVLDGWLSSFRWMGRERPPVCDMLDPQ